jgi:uncharacterized membrane protein
MENTYRYPKATRWLFYAICAYFIMNGAQVWETALMVPAWTAAPPSSLIFFQKPYGLDFKVFWIVIHGVHEIIFITALVFNWKIKKRRNLILLVLAGHIAVRVWTLLYFAPTIITFQQLPYSDTVDIALQEKAAHWRNLNYVRVAIFFALNFLLIPGLKIKEKNHE